MRQIAIVGLGLIGGSLGLRIRSMRLGRVVGIDADEDIARRALERGAVDDTGTDLSRVAGAEIVIVAVPMERTIDVGREVAGQMSRGAILTDVASVKGPVVAALMGLSEVRYVGGHPMFGTAGRGIEEAREELPAGLAYVLTPVAESDEEAVRTLTRLIQDLEMRPVLLSPDSHDRAAAQASHLPYLMALLLAAGAGAEAREIAGPAFRDATRVAQSPPELWAEILKQNRRYVLAALDGLDASLTKMRDALGKGHIQQVVRAR